MLKICTVYFGDLYTPEYVGRLFNSIRKNSSIPFQSVCISDNPDVSADIVLPYNHYSDVKKHWHKLKFFSPNFADQHPGDDIIVMDIDQVITNNIDDLIGHPVQENELVTYGIWWESLLDTNGGFYKFKSGSLKFVWDDFIKNPEYWQTHYYKIGDVHFKYYGEQNYVDWKTRKYKATVTKTPEEWIAKYHDGTADNIELNKIYCKKFDADYMILDDVNDKIKVVHFTGPGKTIHARNAQWIDEYWRSSDNDFDLSIPYSNFSSPGNVDTTGWFKNNSEKGKQRKEDPNSIMNRAKDKDNWFCVHPFTEMFVEIDGRYQACCLAGKDNVHNISNTSFKSWMEDSDYMNGLRKEMLNPNLDLDGNPTKDNKLINQHCTRCVKDEKRYGRSRRTYHMWKESNNPKNIWDAVEKVATEFEKTGKYNWSEKRICQIQVKSFGVECNLDCHMCMHENSDMRIKMAKKHDLWNTKVFGDIKHTLKKFQDVEDNLTRIDIKDVINQVCELGPYLRSIKIIGGEPLIMKQYYELLDAVIASGHAKDIVIKFQTNLTKLVAGKHKFIDYIPHFKYISFTASIDGIGKYAEYCRRRSNWQEIEDNIDLLNDQKFEGKAWVEINSVITCFNVLRYYEVIDYQKNHPGIRSANWLMIEWPKALRVNNLPDKIKKDLIPKYESFPDIQSALEMPADADNDFQNTISYMLKQDEAYKGTKWEMNLFDIFPELEEFK